MKIKLYHYPATRSARVLWLLGELAPEVDWEVERLDLYGAEQYRSEFRDRFPLHALPAVQITLGDGSRIDMTESGAIVVTLADAVPRKGLAPAATPLSPARADYLQMIHACGATFDMILWQIRIHEHVLNADQRDERTIARYRRKFTEEVAPMLLRRLTRSPFICGDQFTAADCMAGHVVLWARTYGLCQEEAARTYLSRLSKRPAFRAAFADATEFVPMLPPDAATRTAFTGYRSAARR